MPAKGSDIYEKYFQHQKQIQRYVYKCLYGDEIIQWKSKEAGYKFKFDATPSSTSTLKQDDAKLANPKSAGSEGKVVITGDDVLIEYVMWLIKILKEVSEV